jgi:hypothetical protein
MAGDKVEEEILRYSEAGVPFKLAYKHLKECEVLIEQIKDH